MDKLDQKILLELDRNCRQSNSQIAKKTLKSKQVIDYRIKRLEKNTIERYPTVINTFNLGYRKYKVFFSLTNPTSNELTRIIEIFKSQPTEWITFGSGKFDLIVSLLVKTPEEFLEKLEHIYANIGKYIHQKVITEVVEVPHWTKKYLGGSQKIIQGFTKIYEPTDEEEEFIRLIANNGRMQITQIAKRLTISTQTAIQRLKKLKSKNIIQQSRVQIYQKDWIYAKAFVSLTHNSRKIYHRLIEYCDNLENMNHLVRCIGPWDYELDFEIESFTKFHNIMTKFRNDFADVMSDYDFTIITKEIKLDYFPNAEPASKNNL